MIEEETIAAVRARAKQLADSAPPLTNNQALMLVSLFARYPASGHDTANQRGES